MCTFFLDFRELNCSILMRKKRLEIIFWWNHSSKCQFSEIIFNEELKSFSEGKVEQNGIWRRRKNQNTRSQQFKRKVDYGKNYHFFSLHFRYFFFCYSFPLEWWKLLLNLMRIERFFSFFVSQISFFFIFQIFGNGQNYFSEHNFFIAVYSSTLNR